MRQCVTSAFVSSTLCLWAVVGSVPVSGFTTGLSSRIRQHSVEAVSPHHVSVIRSRRNNGNGKTTRLGNVGEGRGEYYGESGGSFMVREFSLYDQLKEIVELSSQSLPERPDGIVCVVKYSSQTQPDCRANEAEYERTARNNPATLFLRCFEEYQDAPILLAQANVQSYPTYDIFYGGNRVARVEGSSCQQELQELLDYYQFQNSKLDLFSEEADNARRLQWGDGKIQDTTNRTPRTTNRFIPGYDWNKDKGFFDDMGDKFQEDFDKIYGNWVPNIDDGEPSK